MYFPRHMLIRKKLNSFFTSQPIRVRERKSIVTMYLLISA